jgi:MFS family permease
VMIGTVLGAVGIAMAIAQIPAGYISDRIGSRYLMWISWILGTIAGWIMALATSMSVFIVGMLIYGLTAFVSAPLNAYITTMRGKYSVGRAISFGSGVYVFGAIVGPFAAGLISETYGLRTIYWIATVFFTLSTILIFFIQADHHDARHEPAIHDQPLHRNYRFIGFMGLVAFSTFAVYLAQPLTSNFLQNERLLTKVQIGTLGAVSGFGNTLITLVLGSLRPGIGLIIGQILVAVFGAAIWQGNGMVWYGVGYLGIGGYRLYRSMSLAYTRGLVNRSELGLAYGLNETINSLGTVAAPMLAGYLYAINPESIYSTALILIAVSLACSAFILPRLRLAKPTLRAKTGEEPHAPA